MKKVFIAWLALFIAVSPPVNAQFLKKMKEKAEKKIMGDTPPSSGTGNENNSNAGQFASSKYGEKKLQLRKGEKILNGESCIMIKDNGEESFTFVTKMDDKYYYYDENGQISGPFDKPPVDKLWCWQKSRDYNSNIQNNNSQRDMKTPTENYMIVRQTNPPYELKIGGKSYGPYSMIMNLYVSPGETSFFASVLMAHENSDKMEYYLVNPKGKVQLPNLASSWYISPNGLHCAIPYTEDQLSGKVVETIDPNATVYLFHEDGHKTGPFVKFYANSSSNYAFTNSSKFVYLKFEERNTLYVDDKPTLKFPVEITNFNALILNDDVTGGVYFDNGSLEFSDGTSIRNEAMQPTLIRANGKSFVKWMAVDNEGNIYVCKKEI